MSNQLKVKRYLKIELSREKVNWYVLFFLQAFPFVVPDGLSTLFPYLNLCLYKYWQYFGIITVIAEFLYLSTRKKNCPPLIIGVLFVCAYLALITFIHSGSFSALYANYGMMVYAALLVYNKQAHLDRFTSGLLLILKFWIYINFVCMILFPEGMYKSEANNSYLCWVLGYKSSFQYYILPAICFSWINMVYRGKRVQFFILCAISGYEAIFSKNAMLMVGLAVMLVFYCLRLFQYQKVMHMKNYLWIIGIMNAAYIFFINTILSWGWVQSILLFFEKNMTLSNRLSVITPNTLEAIKRSWLLGHGVWSTERRISMYEYLKAAIHAHNQVLEILFVGGLVLLIAYILLNLLLNHKLMKYKKLECAKIIALTIFVLYIMMLVEVFTRRAGGPLWSILFIAYYCNRLDTSFRQRKDCVLSVDY